MASNFVYWLAFNENNSRWVIQGDSGRVISKHRKKSRAVEEAKRLAKQRADSNPNQRVEISIHTRAGQPQRTEVFNEHVPEMF